MFTRNKNVQVKPEKGSENDITFNNYQPLNENIFKVGYLVSENKTSATVKNEQVYLANKDVEIKVAGEPKPVIENKIQAAFTPIPFQNQILQGYHRKTISTKPEERLLKN